ncbi:MAG: prolyl oligopeptidase family serine peptidase [Vulcanimicrobiaceae bacterium]
MTARADSETDPYAYLEDATDPRTIAWTRAQNARTRAALDAVPGRPHLETRLDDLLRTDVVGLPVVRGTRAFFMARRGEAVQASLYVSEAGRERILVDPTTRDAAGLVAIDWWYPSCSGDLVAFGVSRDGDERSTLHVVETATGSLRDEAIPDTRYASVAWTPGDAEFYYTRYPAGGSYDVRVYVHVVGTPHATDALVFGTGRKSEDMFGLDRSPDGRYLVVNVADGWSRSDAYVADTHERPLRFAPLAEGIAAQFDVRAGKNSLYVRTNDGAPRFRVFRVSPTRLERDAWVEVVPEAAGALDAFAVAGDALVLHYLEDVRSVLRVRHADGAMEDVNDLRGRSVLALGADARGDDAAARDAYVQLASFVEAPEIARLRCESSPALETWARIATPFEASAYRVEQRWFASRDGTRVPMSVVARHDTPFDGTAPAVLYGYGGFNVSLVPSYAPSIVPWLDAGGVYVVANLRGGGEFGEAWHEAGMRARKQNVFDDFIAAAQFLGTSGIADAARIAVMGGSNGGLLVAAFATQRPDLARAVVCLVPLTDMLRFHEFLIARLWISEYGDPNVPSDAAILRAYSPYHNVRDGVAYPAMLVATAESDGRVDPMHARKFGARVADATSGDAPVYVYVEPNAGHGVGKPRHKVVAELADRWSFIASALGVALEAAVRPKR